MAQSDDIRSSYGQITDRLYKDRQAFADFLEFSGRFYKLPSAQTMAVFSEKPNARMVADYDTWAKFARHVKRGERGIGFLSNGEIKYCFDISQTSGESAPFQWKIDKQLAERYIDKFASNHEGNFSSLTQCVSFVAVNEVSESIDTITDSLHISSKNKSEFLKSARSMVREVMKARCEYQSSIKLNTAPLDLSALDMLHSKAEFEKLCEWVQLTAKSALYKIEKSINEIIFERSIYNERNQANMERGRQEVLPRDDRGERTSLQARPDNVDVSSAADVGVQRGGSGADEAADRDVRSEVAGVYAGEPSVRDRAAGDESAVRFDSAGSGQRSGEDVRTADGAMVGSTSAPTDDVHGDRSVGENENNGVQTHGNGGSRAEGQRNLKKADTLYHNSAEDISSAVSLSENDLIALHSIQPRKSVLNFSAEELAATSAFAKQFEIGINKKSPFYRAINGEWRDKEATTVPIINVENRNASFKSVRDDIKSQTILRGTAVNNDTGWTIQVSRNGLEDTMKYAAKHKDTAVYNALYHIEDIVENSVLLDTVTSEHNKSSKAFNTEFMHKMYGVFNLNGENYLAKLTVEEFPKNSADLSPLRRLYNLQDIKIEPLRLIEFKENPLARSVLNGSDISISQLFQFVKTFDKDFYLNHANASLKQENITQGSLAAYRLGDFYEFFDEDAQITSNLLNLTLTKRNGTPMTGIPEHAFENYKEQLSALGYRVNVSGDSIENILNAEKKENEQISLFDNELGEENRFERIISAENALKHYSESKILYYDGVVRKAFLESSREDFNNAVQSAVSNALNDFINGELIDEDVSKEIFSELFDEMHMDGEYAARVFGDISDKVFKLHTELDKGRQTAHELNLPYDEYTYDPDEDFNPYAYDPNRMSDEDYNRMNELIAEDRAEAEKLIGKSIYIEGREYRVEKIILDGSTGFLAKLHFDDGATQSEIYEDIDTVRSMVRSQETSAIKVKIPFTEDGVLDGKLKDIEAELNGYIKPPVAETANLNSVVIDLTPRDEPHREVEQNNFKIDDNLLSEGGQKTRYAANVSAIRTLKQIETEGRTATADEQKILSQYVGWGGIAQTFDSENSRWSKEYAELKELLTDEEYAAARASTLNAHYTTPTVINAMYKALDNMGFKSGNVLEPAMGVGNFFGCMPDKMNGSNLYGVELDSITGRIAQQLYPNANIQIKGYEQTDFPDNFFDVAIGNVPFGNYPVADKRYDKEKFFIHDYFFAKTLDKVAPGGIIAFITTKGTLDKENSKAREYIAKRAELIGAIRLPNNAFKGNANTEVTSDIIFLRKREKMAVDLPDWCYIGKNEDGIPVNQYYLDYPEMILGKMSEDGKMYGGYNTTCVPIEGVDLAEQLDKAVSKLKANITVKRVVEENAKQRGIIPATEDVRNFTYTLIDGKMYFRENNIMTEVEEKGVPLQRMIGMHELRNTLRCLITAQENRCSDDELAVLQTALNERYDKFVKKYGNINANANSSAFSDDDDYNLLCALENYDSKTKTYSKSDIFTTRTIKPAMDITHVDTPQEALQVSLDIRGKVDVTYISALCDFTPENAVKVLADSNLIYLNPEKYNAENPFEGYEEAGEYLSGNVREKLDTALKFAKDDPIFERNAAALENVLPPTIEANDIFARIGVNWVDVDDYKQFLTDYSQASFIYQSLRRTPMGEYKIDNKHGDRSVTATSTYGTKRLNSYEIFERLLNNRDIVVRDPKTVYKDGKEKTVYIINSKETCLAQDKADMMKEAFKNWLWDDPSRREKYVARYNRLFNSIVGREYDGSHQTFPGMSPFIKLNPHQMNAVMRTKLGGNTLLAHCVGAGKSFEMIAATMEKKRIGLINKACVVVPKPLVRQMANEWIRLYPEANILVANKGDFTGNNKQKFIGRCCTGDYTAVIMSYEQFENIPMSLEYRQQFLKRELKKIEEAMSDTNDRISVKDLERLKKRVQARIEKLINAKPKNDVLTFEQLGFDSLVVDEAHNYKNGLVVTKMSNVAGVQSTPAQKSEDILMKTQYMNEQSGYKNIIFATGTPVSNSMVELYTMQRYLRPDLLEKSGFENFDDWASTFGEVVTQLEPTPDGTDFRPKKRFAKFANLPELIQMYKEFADIRTADMLKLPVPEIDGGKPMTVLAKPNEFQQEYVKVLAERSEQIHAGNVDSHEDNMLKITHEARHLGLDARCINPAAENDPESKVNMCIDRVKDIYDQTTEKKGVQVIFCDIAINSQKTDGTPCFSVYNYIREELARRGIPREEICAAGDAKDDKKRTEMFSQLNSGTKRILIASTGKMGTGANFQQKLCALHNLDIPWKPSDLEQRLGRIVRQGNENKSVQVFNYLTEKTFDSYMMSIIVNKQKFISQIMTGKTPARTCQDVDEMVLNYSEMQAIASGDPRVKEKIELDNDVARLRLLESEHARHKFSLQDIVAKCEQEIRRISQIALPNAQHDKAYAEKNALPEDTFKIELGGNIYTERAKAGEALRKVILRVMSSKEDKTVGEYCGFTVSLSSDCCYTPKIKLYAGGMTYYADSNLDSDIGNITRIENVLKIGIDKRIESLQVNLEEAKKNLAEAERTKDAPFEYADELREKSARLEELNKELNIEKVDEVLIDDDENLDAPDEDIPPQKPDPPKRGRR